MNKRTLTWINLTSVLGFLALISWYISGVFGSFFSSLAMVNAQDSVYVTGRIFGIAFLTLLGTGAILIPGELFGFVRLYDRKSSDSTLKMLVWRYLLVAQAFLSLVSIAALVAIGKQIATF